jgi:hypothetical protein
MGFASWLIDTINVASATGTDNFGQPTYGTPRAINARVEAETRLVISPDGNQLMVNHKIAVAEQLYTTDRIWLPGDSTSDVTKARRSLLINSAATRIGTFRFWEVYL